MGIGVHEGWTALMRACDDGKVESARLLLGKGADVEIMDGRRNTALDRRIGGMMSWFLLLDGIF